MGISSAGRKWIYPADITIGYIGGAIWRESNGVNLFMRCTWSGKNYILHVAAGPELTTSIKKDRVETKNALFYVRHKFAAAHNEEAEKMFKRTYQEIYRTAGSFGYALATGQLEKGWEVHGKAAFLSYMEATSGIKRSPYFKVFA